MSAWCSLNNTLLPRTEVAMHTGGLEMRGVKDTVDNVKPLLDDISLLTRPDTLTAIIGGSGAGKTAFARLDSRLSSLDFGLG
ncbi:hypothetical protein [Mycobacterium leprae]|nr:hypothetical protein [Mycobacterium leprae]